MIRLATEADLDRSIELGKKMWSESRYRFYDYNEEKTRNFLSTCINHKDGMFFVAEVEGQVVGGVCGWIDTFYFGNDRLLVDILLFVEPGRRGQLVGMQLLKRYTEFGKENGVAQIVISNSTDVDKERTAALYEAAGYKRVGYVYTLNNKE